jgi:hypothetical protein
MDEFESRCEKAIEELTEMERLLEFRTSYLEAKRIGGKIEGVKLALDYYRFEKGIVKNSFEKKREQLYDNLRKGMINNFIKNEGTQDGDGIK